MPDLHLCLALLRMCSETAPKAFGKQLGHRRLRLAGPRKRAGMRKQYLRGL